jgi:hypothetical protein
MEMRTCGAVSARWTIPTRTLHICYEMIREFAHLYRDDGPDRRRPQRKVKRRA